MGAAACRAWGLLRRRRPPPSSHLSKVTLPRLASGFVSPPERSARVTGRRTGTAREPVRRRQRRASSHALSTSGPANCVIASDGSASAVSASTRPTSRGSTGCIGNLRQGTMPNLAVAANVRAMNGWNCVARTIVQGTAERWISSSCASLAL